ncbi:MAG: DUF2927 domain-containing protein [Rhodobacteraceae bacterium]|nr:DUF2927 domain-containing protein [Paracoccaceae bacterium]
MAALLVLGLAACGGPSDTGASATRASGAPAALGGPALSFPPEHGTPPRRSNAEMQADFMALVFRMESGRTLPVLTRFEGPVTVRMTGEVPPFAGRDLDRLLARLRDEAGIDITRTDRPGASITVEFVPRAALRALAPTAACFVAPGVSSWRDYRAARRGGATDWTTLSVRTRAAVFIPGDTGPQEARDCLHEELAQGLGPLNDLYELPDSVFNDDNINGVLTGFDMLILRAIYAPELHSGMGPEAVAARLPALFARLNPAGGSGPTAWRPETPRAFIAALDGAISPRASAVERRGAALRATTIADRAGWADARAGFAWFLRGRLDFGSRPEPAIRALTRADAIYAASPLTAGAHRAHVAMHLAAFALTQGQAEAADRLASSAMPAAAESRNAALLASLMMVRAEALRLEGRADEAQAQRREAIAWARYGLGSEAEIRRRLDDIGALSPLGRGTAP